MAETGAIIVGDNLLWRPEFDAVTTEGTGWESPERLLTPQLQPKASRPGASGSIGVSVTASVAPARQPSVFALLGVVGGALGNLRVEREEGKGWEPVEDYDVFELASVYQRHIVVILRALYPATVGWRLRWSGSSAIEIGSIYLGRALIDPGLADQGWSQEYPDRASRVVSEGGQLYASDTDTYRIVRIPQGDVDPQIQLGVVPHGQIIDLPPDFATGGASFSGDGVTCGPSSGTATWSTGSLATGNVYRLDYRYREVGAFAEADSRLRVSGSGYSTLYGADPLPTGRRSVIFRRTTNSGGLSVSFASAPTGNTAHLELLGFSEIPDPGAVWGDTVMEDNMQSFYARHGNSRPVIVMLRPSDPMANKVTGIYGIVRDPVRATDRAGQYTQAQLVIEEQR